MTFFSSSIEAEEFKHRLLKEYEGEYDVLIAFIEVFTAKSEELVNEAKKSFGQKRTDDFTRHIHSLKGSLTQLYLKEMIIEASAIESHSRSEGLSVDLLKQVEALEQKLLLLNKWLREHFFGESV